LAIRQTMAMEMTRTEEGKLACSSLRSPGTVGRMNWGVLEPSWELLALHQSLNQHLVENTG